MAEIATVFTVDGDYVLMLVAPPFFGFGDLKTHHDSFFVLRLLLALLPRLTYNS